MQKLSLGLSGVSNQQQHLSCKVGPQGVQVLWCRDPPLHQHTSSTYLLQNLLGYQVLASVCQQRAGIRDWWAARMGAEQPQSPRPAHVWGFPSPPPLSPAQLLPQRSYDDDLQIHLLAGIHGWTLRGKRRSLSCRDGISSWQAQRCYWRCGSSCCHPDQSRDLDPVVSSPRRCHPAPCCSLVPGRGEWRGRIPRAEPSPRSSSCGAGAGPDRPPCCTSSSPLKPAGSNFSASPSPYTAQPLPPRPGTRFGGGRRGLEVTFIREDHSPLGFPGCSKHTAQGCRPAWERSRASLAGCVPDVSRCPQVPCAPSTSGKAPAEVSASLGWSQQPRPGAGHRPGQGWKPSARGPAPHFSRLTRPFPLAHRRCQSGSQRWAPGSLLRPSPTPPAGSILGTGGASPLGGHKLPWPLYLPLPERFLGELKVFSSK